MPGGLATRLGCKRFVDRVVEKILHESFTDGNAGNEGET